MKRAMRTLLPAIAASALLFATACADDTTTPDARPDARADIAEETTAPGTPDVAAPDDVTPLDTAPGDVAAPETTQDVETDAHVDDEPTPLNPPHPQAPFFAEHPEIFGRMSSFATHVEGPARERPKLGERGAFGGGNGHVFALFGLADPLNTLHSLTGPTYERRPNFFGNYKVLLALEEGEAALWFDEEWAGQSLAAPVVVTSGRVSDLVLETADFAPHTEGDYRNCFVRILAISNQGPHASDALELRILANNPTTSPSSNELVEVMQQSRVLATRFVEPGAVAEGRTLSISLGSLAPNETRMKTLTHCTAEGVEPPPMPEGDIEELLADTAEHYRSWQEATVQMDVPEEWVRDFWDGMKMTLTRQTSVFGATCPMSHYTHTWPRDNVGPVKAMLAMGAHENAAAMLDYLYGAILYNGGLRNAYPADLDPALAPEPPDWDERGTLGTRVGAETPRYMVLMYGLHHRYTGDLTRAHDRWRLLYHCMFDQRFGPDLLLPFTNDETFRAAMNSTFGLDIEYDHHEKTWSANSAALWLGAAHEFARLAELLGENDDRDEVQAKAADLETHAIAHYIGDDGCMAALLDRETLTPSPPFEDASLQVTWSGWKDGDTPLARDNIECLMEQLRRAPGVLQSDMHERYIGMFRGGDQGVYTGMLPGYTLAALTDVGHPEAHAAFEAVLESLDTSGNLHEYMLFEDRIGLSLVYDPTGLMGDYTAKYRPWEGGIVAEAVFRYLVGFRPDVTAGTLSFRPHLPDSWEQAAYTNLRAADDRFDLALHREDDTVVVTVTSRATDDWDVLMRWDQLAPPAATASLDGATLESDDLTVHEHFGAVSLAITPQRLPAGGALEYRFSPGD